MVPNLRDNSAQTHLDILKQEDPDIQSLLAVYPEELAEKILVNKKKLDRVVKVFKSMKNYTDTNTIIMTCNSDTCPYKNVCILKLNDMAPETYPCPVEKKLVIELEGDLVASLAIDRNDPIEMELLWDLIDTKLLDMRTSGFLKNGSVTQLVTQQVAKVTQTKEELSPTLLIKLDIKRLKHSIIDSFVATRRAKKKYGMQNDVGTIETLILAAARKNRDQLEDKT
jgi:hypothetical protein